MKKIKKPIIAVFILLVIGIWITPNLYAIHYFDYEVNAETGEIVLTDLNENKLPERLYIPSHIFFRKVTEIQWSAPLSVLRVHSVYVPDTVTVIGDYAFTEWRKLSDVRMSQNLSKIGESAFMSCWALEKIELPSSLHIIPDSSFAGCKSLNEVIIPEGVTKIDQLCFESCSSLENLVIPEGVTQIGDYAICRCYNLNTITIPASVTDMDWYTSSKSATEENGRRLDNITIITPQGSVAEQYAIENGIAYHN